MHTLKHRAISSPAILHFRPRQDPACRGNPTPITGSIEVTPEGWLHIRLDTLLLHCRYGSVSEITDTVHA